MTDGEAAALIRAAECKGAAADTLKALWREREVARLHDGLPPLRCDCLYFEAGDYVKAWEALNAV